MFELCLCGSITIHFYTKNLNVWYNFINKQNIRGCIKMNSFTQQNAMQRSEDSNHLVLHLESRDKLENQFKSNYSKKIVTAKPLKHALLYAQQKLEEINKGIEQVEIYINKEFRMNNPSKFFEMYQQYESFLVKEEEWISAIKLMGDHSLN